MLWTSACQCCLPHCQWGPRCSFGSAPSQAIPRHGTGFNSGQGEVPPGSVDAASLFQNVSLAVRMWPITWQLAWSQKLVHGLSCLQAYFAIVNISRKNSMVSNTVASKDNSPVSITIKERGCMLCLQKHLPLKYVRLGGWRTRASGLSSRGDADFLEIDFKVWVTALKDLCCFICETGMRHLPLFSSLHFWLTWFDLQSSKEGGDDDDD